MPVPSLAALRRLVECDPEKIPSSTLFSHTDQTLTVFDLYPKATFHFLVLPRIQGSLTTAITRDLKTLLKGDKALARTCLEKLSEEAASTREQIEEEMMDRFGFKWPIYTGFHAVPSMEHLHLHVISSDFLAPTLKSKKHYNSFHPKLGFFLHLDDVLSWFDAEPSYFEMMSKLDKTRYDALLKEDLECLRCHAELKNMPKLKEHLEEEFKKVELAAKAAKAKKLTSTATANSNSNSTRSRSSAPTEAEQISEEKAEQKESS